MTFPRYVLRQGRVGEVDDFGSVPDDEFGSVPDEPARPTGTDPAIVEQQRERRAQAERVPEGMVDSGEVVRRRLILPEMTGLEREFNADNATIEETRRARPMTGFERFVDDNRRYGPGALTAALAPYVGLEAPSAQSAANATRPNRPGESQSIGDRLSALIPTAQQEGSRAAISDLGVRAGSSDADDRTRAMAAGLGTGNPVIGPWLDEMQGITDAATGGNYREGRDRARAQFATVERQAPEASMVGAAAPNIALGLAGGPTAPTAGGRILQAATVGGLLGGNAGAGNAAELEDVPSEAWQGEAIGAASAGAMQGAGEGVARALPWLGSLLRRGGDEATDMAAQDMMRARGLPVNAQPNTAYGRQVQRMGGERGVAAALDAQNVGGRLPTPASTQQSIEPLMARGSADLELAHRSMQNAPPISMRPVVDELGAVRNELAGTRTGPDQAAARRIDRQLIEPLLDQPAPDVEGMATPAEFDFAGAHRLRQGFDRIANYRNANPAQGSIMDAARDARGTLSQIMSDAAANGPPEARTAWQQGNQRYALGAFLRDYARPQGSQFASAVAEGAAENLGGGLAARATRGIISNYGPALRGRTLEALAPRLTSMGGAFARYGQQLQQSLQAGGPRAAAITHYILSSQQPQYRAAVERAQQEQQ